MFLLTDLNSLILITNNAMKRFILICFFISAFSSAFAQEIVYSDYNNEDNREINFEILGKQGVHYVIYKNVRWKHMLALYDDNMRMVKSFRMPFIHDRTFNINFVTYPDYFYIIYQYDKNNTVYCKMVKMDNDGNKIEGPVFLDSGRIWPRQDRNIYSNTFSENKQHILLYKMINEDDKISVMTKVYDKDMQLKDSARQLYDFNDRYDVFSDMVIDNNGTIISGKGKLPNRRANMNGAQLIIKKLNDPFTTAIDIPLENRYIDALRFKVDNVNKQYIVNSFFYKKQNDNIDGLFMALVKQDANNVTTSFYEFADSLRNKMNNRSDTRLAFNNLLIRNIITTKDGGFLLAAENSYSQTTTNTQWRRNDFMTNPNMISPYEYNLMSGNFNNYYRPFNNSPFFTTSFYYYDEIVLLNIGKDLKEKWNAVIPKKQVDEGDDNFMSFAMVNSGGELQILFIEKDKNLQLVSHQAVTPQGNVKRYATLKSREAGYQFMPKLAKQVSASKVIIPCLYRNYISFALVDLSNR